ncbi:type II toxin-antitoxin system HicB family antitoxin [Macellibacteroides fermentans]|uniref:type II toxin-antitoxin system HicB family antitoxin n=1 Tax=Macellibacteroides fermentans TaxID=879969 RepID=UPI00406CC46E
MKTIKDELSRGYEAILPTLRGCITTGESEEAAISNLKDAKIEWMNAALESGISIPGPDIYRLQSIYKNRNRIPKLSR